jgi:hypothetical protein
MNKPDYESADYKTGFADGEYASETAMNINQSRSVTFAIAAVSGL